MTGAERETYRKSLIALQKRLNGDVAHLTDEALRRSGEGASGNLSHAPIHMADMGSDAFEQDLTLSLVENEESALVEIAAALERLSQGTYGHCEECRSAIPKKRLAAVPFTRYCVECATKLEKGS